VHIGGVVKKIGLTGCHSLLRAKRLASAPFANRRWLPAIRRCGPGNSAILPPSAGPGVYAQGSARACRLAQQPPATLCPSVSWPAEKTPSGLPKAARPPDIATRTANRAARLQEGTPSKKYPLPAPERRQAESLGDCRVKIEVLYVLDCPHYPAAMAELKSILAVEPTGRTRGARSACKNQSKRRRRRTSSSTRLS
jgi:hypothetical protein